MWDRVRNWFGSAIEITAQPRVLVAAGVAIVIVTLIVRATACS